MTSTFLQHVPIHRYWRLLSAFQISLIVHVVVYILTPEVGDSTQFRILAGGLVLQALAVIGVTWQLSTLMQSDWVQRLSKLRFLYLLLSLGLLFVFGVLMRHEWVYAHAGLALSATIGLGYLTFFADESLDVQSRWVVGIAGVIALVLIGLRINAIAVYPNHIPTDESWLLGWPVAWVRGLYPNDLLFFNGGEDVFHYFIPMGIWMQIVGTGFVEARVYQLLMTLVLMAITYPLVRRLYDKQTAWLTVLMLFSGSVIVLASTIRHDIGLGILLTTSFLVHRIAVEKDSIRLHFVAGLLVGFGLFTHYHSIAFGPALMIALYAPDYVSRYRKQGWRPQRELILYAIGGLLGAGIVFLVQILPQLDAVLGARQFRSEGGLGLVTSYFEYFAVLAELSQFEFLLILAGMAGLLIRRTKTDIQILLILLLGHLGLAILAAQITLEYYVIPLAPFYAIATVTLFTQTFKQIPAKIIGWVTVCFVVVNLGFVMGTPIQYALRGDTIADAPMPQGARWIIDNVPEGARVVGDLYYFLWLTDYEFYASTSDRYIASAYREIYNAPRDLWDDANPDYVVLDPNIPTYDMQRVLDTGFLDDNPNYEIVATIPGQRAEITIYGRKNINHRGTEDTEG